MISVPGLAPAATPSLPNTAARTIFGELRLKVTRHRKPKPPAPPFRRCVRQAGQRRHLLRIQIENRQVKPAGLDQPRADRPAHGAGADEGDFVLVGHWCSRSPPKASWYCRPDPAGGFSAPAGERF